MKVLCDVCKGQEAAVYCCADEAALCGACDCRVHRANKLAGKHRRFSLIHPASPQQAPLCDICQEKRAFLFCQEDRALLCRDCDAPIHTANDLTKKHNRFLLMGIKLSPSASPADQAATSSQHSECPSSLAVSSNTSEEAEEPTSDVTHTKSNDRLTDSVAKQQERPAVVAPVPLGASEKKAKDFGRSGKNTAVPVSAGAGAASAEGSSISEYLIKELPGWRVEDLLLDASPVLLPAAFPFSKFQNNDLAPFLEADLDAAAFTADDGGNLSPWWVPQVPQVSPVLPPLPVAHDYSPALPHAIGTGTGGDLNKLAARQFQQRYFQQQQQQHHRQRWTSDDCFTVPEITVQPPRRQDPPSHKRPRADSSWCIT